MHFEVSGIAPEGEDPPPLLAKQHGGSPSLFFSVRRAPPKAFQGEGTTTRGNKSTGTYVFILHFYRARTYSTI